MKPSLIAGLLFVAALPAGPVFAQRGSSQPVAARHGWLSDYRQARDAARKSGKPLMLVFRCIP